MNGYVFAANAAIWICLAVYAGVLCLRGRAMANRLKQLESLK